MPLAVRYSGFRGPAAAIEVTSPRCAQCRDVALSPFTGTSHSWGTGVTGWDPAGLSWAAAATRWSSSNQVMADTPNRPGPSGTRCVIEKPCGPLRMMSPSSRWALAPRSTIIAIRTPSGATRTLVTRPRLASPFTGIGAPRPSGSTHTPAEWCTRPVTHKAPSLSQLTLLKSDPVRRV